LIVTSDHSWRTPMWTSIAGLSAEEKAASQGRFDPRPMLMIHFPQQTHEVDVNQPFAQVALQRIIVSMLQGHIESAPDFAAWSQTQWTQEPTAHSKNTLAGATTAKQ
jgi:hypothetical protein